MEINKHKILKHILFWTVIFVFYVFSFASRDVFGLPLITALYKMPLMIIACYAFNYWQIPCYLNRKKHISFVFSIVWMIILLVLSFRIISFFYLDKYCVDGPYPLVSLLDFPLYMFTFHFPALVMYFYKTNKKQEQERQKLNDLEKEKTATELKYLKAQLNPHFLFNTLNNLYSYIITKSPKAPDMVLQLSEILDYILYKSQQSFVTLSEEIHTIENYIALEQIKYGNRLAISFYKNELQKSLEITPLLLLSIVENAFKHGVSGTIINPEIKITLEQYESKILFTVWNTNTILINNNKTDTYKEGIGLTNIKRQLDLIYPGKHQLITENKETFFNLKLMLKLV